MSPTIWALIGMGFAVVVLACVAAALAAREDEARRVAVRLRLQLLESAGTIADLRAVLACQLGRLQQIRDLRATVDELRAELNLVTLEHAADALANSPKDPAE